jgi:hypothetical protein
MDSFLIWFFRISDIPIIGYYVGTAVVCLICVIIGRLTLITGSRINALYLGRDHQKMIRMHNLSLHALLCRDKQSYQSCNKEANEAFGKMFFSQIALGASSLWVVPFALVWMQSRFGRVLFDLPFSLPGLENSVGFMFTFFPILVLTYLLYARICHWRAGVQHPPKNFIEFNEEKLLTLDELTAHAGYTHNNGGRMKRRNLDAKRSI